jgi:hypothetical protein
MLRRCCDPKNPSYKYYGARGITVCPEWADFRNFLRDMGERPSGTTLGRIDHKKHYSKSNCEWQDDKKQGRTTSHCRFLFHQGKTLCVTEWAEIVGIKRDTIIHRLRAGWSVERALSK